MKGVPLQILLLEDQEDDALLLERSLSRGGLQAELCRVWNREGYLEALKRRAWDLILSDFNLPNISGEEALAILRREDQDTPFILVSGEIGEELAAQLMRLGANDFVKKEHLDRLGPAIEREMRDVEMRHQRQEAMDFLSRLGRAMDQSGDLIVMTDAQSRITYVNQAFVEQSKFAADEVLGRSPMAALGIEDDGDRLRGDILEACSQEGSWHGRLKGRQKDATPLHLDVRISPLLDSQGRCSGYVGSHREIGQQLALELRLEQGHRLEAIGTLAGGIAHDFNNVLMAIHGFGEIAQMKTTEPGVKVALDGILRASERARDLVQQILAFSRNQTHDRKPIRIAAVAKEALRFVRATLPASISLELAIDTESRVMGDPTELQRILVNLSTNAMLAMGGGPGCLRVEVRDSDGPKGVGDSGWVRLTVADTGCGMTPEVLARIYEPFFTTRPGTGGTGMGMAVVHGLVLSMNGDIQVETEPGAGTTFHILLPVHEGSVEPSTRQGEAWVQGQGRILFVDDETILCDAASELLNHLGYDCEAFSDPLQALDRLRHRADAFALILTDMTMPGMTGDKFAAACLEIASDIPVIVCTGYSSRLDSGLLLPGNVKACVSKPFDWPAMSRMIQACIQRHDIPVHLELEDLFPEHESP